MHVRSGRGGAHHDDNVGVVTAVVELRPCQHRAVLYTPAACPHLPPHHTPAMEVSGERGGASMDGDEKDAAVAAGGSDSDDMAVDVRQLQACIDELSAVDASERSSVPCAVRWAEFRRGLVDASPEEPADAAEVHRTVYPYQHRTFAQQPHST